MATGIDVSKSNEEMAEQWRDELDSVFRGDYTMAEFLADWGMTEEDVVNNEWLSYPQEEELMRLRGVEDTQADDTIDMSSEDFVPDYTKTAEYEGDGITSELIPGEGLVAPALAGLGLDPTTAAVIGSVATKKPGMLTNKLFAGKNLKKNQLKNRGTEGPVVQGASRTAKNTNLRPSIKNKTADRYKSMSDRVKAKRAGEAATVAGAGTAMYLAGDMANEAPMTQSRNLKGNRDTDGSLIDLNKIARGYDEVGVDETDNSNDEYDYYGNRRAVTKIMNNPDGFLQRQMRKKSTSGKTEQFGQDDTGRIIKVAPKTMGNQYGWHKEPGQNFWDVNDDDPYWDTHVMGTGGAWSDADVKEEVQEIDWSGWKNLFKGEG